jgi:hypothetical protein
MDRRLFVRDTDARELLKEAIDQLKKPHLIPIVLKPFIVRRRDKVPVVLRIWSVAAPAHLPLRRTVSPVQAILSVCPVWAVGLRLANHRILCRILSITEFLIA